MRKIFLANNKPRCRLIVGVSFVVIAAALACLFPAYCGEGMWLPQELSDEVMRDMRLNGCELSKDEIYNGLGTGVANAVVRVGATGSFVSPEGLILTNHHVAFGAVQRMSTLEHNYIREGFLARSREEEVPAVGYTIYVGQSVNDVTREVLSAVKPSMSPLQRYKAIERRTREIVKKAEKGRDVYCEVRGFFGESRYLLYTSIKIKDVRVVYVPARSIGEYGGEVDNWMWPRHTCDFSFLRAYVAADGKTAEYSKGNVPYRPKTYLKIAAAGLREGDFAFIIGFPAWTDRYLSSYALSDLESFEFPQQIRLQGQMVRILEEQSGADPVAAVRVAGQMKGIYNYLKKDRGILEGFKRFRLVEQQKEMEGKLLADSQADMVIHEKYNRLLGRLESLYEENSKCEMKDLLLEYLVGQRSLLGEAMLLYKWSVEKTKKDLDRDSGFADRDIPDMKRDLKIFNTGFHPGSDRGLLEMFLREIAGLPEGQRVAVVDEMLGLRNEAERERAIAGEASAELQTAIGALLDGLYSDTRLDKAEERLRMFDMSRSELLKEGDPFIALAAKLYEENEKRIERRKSFAGALDMLIPQWIEMLTGGLKAGLYADGNGTMRLSYGCVEGYAPRDAVLYRPFTTLKGVVEKHTGADPFDCPERILELAASRTYGPYASSDFDDVVANVLTSNDSTNGNSGSPLLNSKGELVGCLFDGNYEALSSDFQFEDDLTRSISVDIRYILFVTDFVDNAQNVLQELGLKQ
ncbi:MAG: S46 family peptidase [Candidatus Eisenbacteria bacterium]|nr:S46 family peptidase [Candidatus Eisenbacteria bacterium]